MFVTRKVIDMPTDFDVDAEWRDGKVWISLDDVLSVLQTTEKGIPGNSASARSLRNVLRPMIESFVELQSEVLSEQIRVLHARAMAGDK